jgi:hypothetical protein
MGIAMSKLHFWLGIGAAQTGARSKGANSTNRRHQIISIVVGILIPLLIAAVLLILFAIDQ